MCTIKQNNTIFLVFEKLMNYKIYEENLLPKKCF